MGQEQTRSLDALILEEVLRVLGRSIDLDINHDPLVEIDFSSGRRTFGVPWHEARISVGRAALRGRADNVFALTQLLVRRFPLVFRQRVGARSLFVVLEVVVGAEGYTKGVSTSALLPMPVIESTLEELHAQQS